MNGKPVKTPVPASFDGPATLINLREEVPYKTWLANMHAKAGKVHFMYRASNPGEGGPYGDVPKIRDRQHYMRFDARTGKREIDSWSMWKQRWGGEKLVIDTTCGFFASDIDRASGPLFAVGGTKGERLAALVSYNNGQTWRDYAVSRGLGKVWAEGGSRDLSPNGYVFGTLATDQPKWATTQFFYFNGRPPKNGD